MPRSVISNQGQGSGTSYQFSVTQNPLARRSFSEGG